MAKKKNNFISDASIFIATFAPFEDGKRLPTNGMIEPMLSFFLPRAKKVTLLIEPHSGSDFIDPIVEEYKADKLQKSKEISKLLYFPIYLLCKFQNDHKTHISLKLRDFLSVLFVGFFTHESYDYFIGLESVNALAGVLLKRFGKVKKVIYYVSDYSPTRFGETFFNKIYLWLDKYCAMHTDIIWDVSPVMQNARITVGLDAKCSAPVIIMPNALFPSQIKALPIEKRIPFSLVFMGSLGFENGPDLAIESLKEVKKRIPQATLHIIGGGKQNLERLKLLTKKIGLEKDVVFHGFVLNNDDMAALVRKCYIALAPYRALPQSVRWYADATKIRQYLASGLPIVTTQVPPLGKVVAEKGAAIIANDSVNDFSKAIIKLLTDKKMYSDFEKTAQKLSQENTWENEYTKAFEQVKRYEK